jgi:hypothetical protein
MKHWYRRQLTHSGYKYDPKVRTGAIKPAIARPLVAPTHKRAPEPVLNYPPRPTY